MAHSDCEAKAPLLTSSPDDENEQLPGESNYSSINTAESQIGRHVASRDQASTYELPELGESGEYKVYARRWYILLLYSLLAWTQAAVWNTFGPISDTAEHALGWGVSTIALLSNWGPISALVATVFFCWAIDVKGLRIACLLASFLIALGTGLRCITVDPPAVTWLMHAGQALNGLAGPVAMAAPPAISAVWFPAHQRTTATAVGSLFGMMGAAGGFVLGPMLVPEVASNTTNTSTLHASDFTRCTQYVLEPNNSVFPPQNPHHFCSGLGHLHSEERRIQTEKRAISVYMYIEAGWSSGLFLLLLLYFPSRPPVPPCASATIQRQSFFAGIGQLFMCRQPHFWLLAVVYGVSKGVCNVWSGVLDVILKPHGISQKQAGWIGFYGICCASVTSLIVARFADFFSRIMKWLLLFFYVIATAAFLVFTLAANSVITPSTALFYAAIITGTAALNAAVPLTFELSCELAYPTGEGATNGILTIINNTAGVVFLFVLMVPHIGSMWTNYTLVGACGVCLPLLLALREQYNRLEIDQHNPSLNAEITVSA